MKKPYMHTIISPSERDWVLILSFQRNGSIAGLFDGDLFRLDQYDPPNFQTGRTNPIQY